MPLPDWRNTVLEENVFPEPGGNGDRLVVWLLGGHDREFQYWQRVGSVAGGAIRIEQGLCAIAAVVVPARQRVQGWLGKLFQRLRSEPSDQAWILPNGESAEPAGQRRTDAILVWAEAGTEPLDEARIRLRWPKHEAVRRIGSNLFLVTGVTTRDQPDPKSAVPMEKKGCPREAARRMLAAARQAGDRRAEAMALADLGVMRLQEGKKRVALTMLEKATALTRGLGDRVKESDVLGSFGKAAMAAGQNPRAQALFRRSLATARQAQDRFAEKLALEHLGTFHSRSRAPARARTLFAQALKLARETGDRHHQAKLLWQLAVANAELGQRDRAIARAKEAVAVFKDLGRPEAAWFADHLQKYRAATALETSGGGGRGPAPELSPPPPPNEPIDATLTSSPPNPAAPRQPQAARRNGPGLLRMAASATKAMARFIKSGMKPVSPQVYDERLQTCAGCEYHSGLRCRICGCFTNMKAQLPHEQCPVGKWPVHVQIQGLAQPSDLKEFLSRFPD